MEILHENSNFPKKVSLILGFFNGVHIGHQTVIDNTLSAKKVIVTFSESPAEYFKKGFEYIYPRKIDYEFLEKTGVDYILELNFNKIANQTASEYLNYLIENFEPCSITTGFNHTFGKNKQGNPDFLEKFSKAPYICTPPTLNNEQVVSSSLIKQFLKEGQIEQANSLLGKNFLIESIVIDGAKLGRKLGFPTANLKYPDKIVKIPHGVYKVKVDGQAAVMNWGIKPTINAEELMEVHIPNFSGDLYGKGIRVEIIAKIRDEKKFDNLEDLKNQIRKDINKCLES